ncbi:MAG: DNA topoisomerase 1 [Candidatus Hydrogenedentota bacterium]
MAKYLVVVESPAKAKTINKFLGSNYVVRASYGHVRDLPKSDLGVDIENDFNPKYVNLRDSAKAIKELKAVADKVQTVLVASDPDREGEAIGWHVAEILKKSKKDLDIRRIVFNEITKKSVTEATKHPRDIDSNLVNAQQARRVLDRLVGYKISPLLNWSIRKGLSAGRVQSVAVRMVCDRESEIRAFVPVEYWSLEAELLTQEAKSLTARLNRFRGEKAEIGSRDQMLDVLKALKVNAVSGEEPGAVVIHGIESIVPFSVKSVEKKEVRRRPYAPFITSTLQQEASRKLGFTPRRTMIIAQQLYEGLDLGPDGTDGLITYMRTDSTRLADDALQDVRAYITQNYQPPYLPESANRYVTKKDAQDAHEAIRPTVVSRTPEAMAKYLSDEQLKLYTLIWKRFVACQMSPAVLDQTTVDIEAGEAEFRATGSVMKFPGFTILYNEDKDDTNGESDADKLLPEVRERETLSARELKPEQHFTKPPPRYSEASLIRALEEQGIGRPSTYAPTINTILERGYVDRVQGRLRPTELGEEVNALLVKLFEDILDYGFTARLEADLDHVEEGTREWHELIREFYVPFEKDLTAAQKRMIAERVGDDAVCPKCGGEIELREGFFGPYLACKKKDCDGKISLKAKTVAEPTDEICDKCGGQMVIRSGRFGKFLACSNYPTCKNTFNLDKNGNKVASAAKEEPIKTDQKCPDCGGMLLIRKSRAGEPFYGCSKYPKCKFTKPMEVDVPCPKCGGELVRKLAKRRRFIGCGNYPKCDFTVFGQIDKESACPKCGHDWTVVQRPKDKPATRNCPVPECGFEEEVSEEKVEAAAEE